MRISSLLLLALLAPVACGSSADETKEFPAETAAKAIADYGRNVHASYTDVLTAAKTMQTAIGSFIAAPTATTFEAAKKAWIAARVPYGPSEAFRFYDGPIDNPDDGPEGEINGWPLDEFEIDYTRDTPTSGLINDMTFALTPDSISAENEKHGEKAITTGWHAIEFLLWGQDDTKPGTGPGKRPLSDYVDGAQGGQNQARRRTYLKDVTQLLIDDLEPLVAAWAPDEADNFRGKFGTVARDAKTQPDAKKEAIGDLLRSIGSMAKAELSGERMTVAFKNRSEEDEHSCFSDTTASDLLGNGVGIENVWLGRYGSFDGVGLDEVVRAIDADLAAKTTADLADSVAKLRKLEALQTAGTPIDVILQAADDSEGRKAMLEAIKALKVVAEDTEKAARALGLSITIEDPSEDL